MHNPDTYEACMAQESAEKRIRAKLADLREEMEADMRGMWAAYYAIRSELNEARCKLVMDIQYGLPFIENYVW